MISFTAIASSSAGNAYIVTDGVTSLLLECGVKLADLRKAIGFRLTAISGCLITHEHGDHCSGVKEALRAGIDVYTSPGTIEALGMQNHRLHSVEPGKTFSLGTWTILPFDVQHDVAQPVGYLMASGAEKMVFLTDTYYCRYRFDGLTTIAVECNYSLQILDENIAAGRVPSVMRRRLLRSHFSLENVKDFLRANDLSKVSEIHLLHLSDNNSDAELFKQEVQAISGCPVYIAGR